MEKKIHPETIAYKRPSYRKILQIWGIASGYSPRCDRLLRLFLPDNFCDQGSKGHLLNYDEQESLRSQINDAVKGNMKNVLSGGLEFQYSYRTLVDELKKDLLNPEYMTNKCETHIDNMLNKICNKVRDTNIDANHTLFNEFLTELDNEAKTKSAGQVFIRISNQIKTLVNAVKENRRNHYNELLSYAVFLLILTSLYNNADLSEMSRLYSEDTIKKIIQEGTDSISRILFPTYERLTSTSIDTTTSNDCFMRELLSFLEAVSINDTKAMSDEWLRALETYDKKYPNRNKISPITLNIIAKKLQIEQSVESSCDDIINELEIFTHYDMITDSDKLILLSENGNYNSYKPPVIRWLKFRLMSHFYGGMDTDDIDDIDDTDEPLDFYEKIFANIAVLVMEQSEMYGLDSLIDFCASSLEYVVEAAILANSETEKISLANYFRAICQNIYIEEDVEEDVEEDANTNQVLNLSYAIFLLILMSLFNITDIVEMEIFAVFNHAQMSLWAKELQL